MIILDLDSTIKKKINSLNKVVDKLMKEDLKKYRVLGSMRYHVPMRILVPALLMLGFNHSDELRTNILSILPNEYETIIDYKKRRKEEIKVREIERKEKLKIQKELEKEAIREMKEEIKKCTQ